MSQWSYDPVANPHAVSVEFRPPRQPEPIVWAFDRSLATNGLTAYNGQGDVRLWPADTWLRGRVGMSLTHDFTARFLIPRRPLTRFLQVSYELVPAGEEEAYMQTIIGLGLQALGMRAD